ncbi:hypothetical protein [Pseudomonas sp. 34 E 7]|nr:hypothetical protein [Pseudomonas sp. 34 E 7]
MPAKQVFETEVLQQAHRRLVFLRQQRLLEGGLPVLLGTEPLAGAPVPGALGRPGLFAQQARQGGKYLQPIGAAFPGLDKRTERLQLAQVLSTVTKAEQMFTQARIEARQVGEHPPGFGQLRRQAVEHFVLQIIEQGFIGMAVIE